MILLDAVKVAIQLMLQEEFDHPITCHLALYSCYAYLKKPQPEPWDPQPKPKPEEPVEEVKVRVAYIREPFFDDHFDLTKPEHLIGKTLVGFGKHLARTSPGPIPQTSIVFGWALFEKHDKLLQSLDSVLKKAVKPALFREALELCRTKLGESSQLPEGFMEQLNNRIAELEKGGFLQDGDILETLRERTVQVVGKHEADDIKAQSEQYKKWEKLREDEVEREVQATERRRRLALLEAKKRELQEKEERLNFFDNLDDWELRFEEKEMQRQALAKEIESRSKKVSAKMQRQAEEDAYFPPELIPNRNLQK